MPRFELIEISWSSSDVIQIVSSDPNILVWIITHSGELCPTRQIRNEPGDHSRFVASEVSIANLNGTSKGVCWQLVRELLIGGWEPIEFDSFGQNPRFKFKKNFGERHAEIPKGK
jgi:hypothetical protein